MARYPQMLSASNRKRISDLLHGDKPDYGVNPHAGAGRIVNECRNPQRVFDHKNSMPRGVADDMEKESIATLAGLGTAAATAAASKAYASYQAGKLNAAKRQHAQSLKADVTRKRTMNELFHRFGKKDYVKPQESPKYAFNRAMSSVGMPKEDLAYANKLIGDWGRSDDPEVYDTFLRHYVAMRKRDQERSNANWQLMNKEQRDALNPIYPFHEFSKSLLADSFVKNKNWDPEFAKSMINWIDVKKMLPWEAIDPRFNNSESSAGQVLRPAGVKPLVSSDPKTIQSMIALNENAGFSRERIYGDLFNRATNWGRANDPGFYETVSNIDTPRVDKNNKIISRGSNLKQMLFSKMLHDAGYPPQAVVNILKSFPDSGRLTPELAQHIIARKGDTRAYDSGRQDVVNSDKLLSPLHTAAGVLDYGVSGALTGDALITGAKATADAVRGARNATGLGGKTLGGVRGAGKGVVRGVQDVLRGGLTRKGLAYLKDISGLGAKGKGLTRLGNIFRTGVKGGGSALGGLMTYDQLFGTGLDVAGEGYDALTKGRGLLDSERVKGQMAEQLRLAEEARKRGDSETFRVIMSGINGLTPSSQYDTFTAAGSGQKLKYQRKDIDPSKYEAIAKQTQTPINWMPNLLEGRNLIDATQANPEDASAKDWMKRFRVRPLRAKEDFVTKTGDTIKKNSVYYNDVYGNNFATMPQAATYWAQKYPNISDLRQQGYWSKNTQGGNAKDPSYYYAQGMQWNPGSRQATPNTAPLLPSDAAMYLTRHGLDKSKVMNPDVQRYDLTKLPKYTGSPMYVPPGQEDLRNLLRNRETNQALKAVPPPNMKVTPPRVRKPLSRSLPTMPEKYFKDQNKGRARRASRSRSMI